MNGGVEYEATARVTWVSDGDTIGVNILDFTRSFEGVTTGKDVVRFAGIDTEELSQEDAERKHPEVEGLTQEEYERTKYFQYAQSSKFLLRSLIPEDNIVYLDFDDCALGKGPRGYYGRLIAVLYIKRGEEWINLNAAILNKIVERDSIDLEDYITEYPSEFNPRRWLENSYPYK